jgi:hypothetical protein
MDGISGTAGVPVPRVIANIRAFVLSAIIYNCNKSFAVNDNIYSTTRHVSVLAGRRARVLLFGTLVPFITGKISSQ